MLEHPLDGVMMLRGWGGCDREAELGAKSKGGHGDDGRAL
jgi:hypothetical protein